MKSDLEDDFEDDYEARVLQLVSRSEDGFRVRLERGVDGLHRTVQMLNRWIIAVDRILWRLQPPTSGRVRVIWIRTPSRSDEDAVTPHIAKWKKVRNGWQTVKLGRRAEQSIEKWGGFERHFDDVRSAVILAKRLIAYRREVIGKGRQLQLSGEERSRANDMRKYNIRAEIERLVESANAQMTSQEMPLDMSYVMDEGFEQQS